MIADRQYRRGFRVPGRPGYDKPHRLRAASDPAVAAALRVPPGCAIGHSQRPPRERSSCCITSSNLARSASCESVTPLRYDRSPPDRATALLRAARSTTAGTPVKSCINTRAGMNAMEAAVPFGHRASATTSASDTSRPPALRAMFSRRILMVCGSRATSAPVFAANFARLT